MIATADDRCRLRGDGVALTGATLPWGRWAHQAVIRFSQRHAAWVSILVRQQGRFPHRISLRLSAPLLRLPLKTCLPARQGGVMEGAGVGIDRARCRRGSPVPAAQPGRRNASRAWKPVSFRSGAANHKPGEGRSAFRHGRAGWESTLSSLHHESTPHAARKLETDRCYFLPRRLWEGRPGQETKNHPLLRSVVRPDKHRFRPADGHGFAAERSRHQARVPLCILDV